MSANDRITIRPYRPGTGTEGACFQEEFCCRCVKDAAVNRHGDDPEWEDGCQILARAYAHDIGEKGYPTEWIVVGDEPQCTAFVEDIGQKWPADATPYELEAAGQRRLFS